ncbi:hypothetical protein GLP31_13040 [Photobacterium carnosum]|uniref:hypothetical protein n=1 Tax=Photobacterium carnosum TaxID=2023717 RepID=UPI001E4D9D7B|nr:hypothetical protein [Photobacterium carnosum]MCD9553406.1 hypothetical protein [Photobacterium carnosum]
MNSNTDKYEFFITNRQEGAKAVIYGDTKTVHINNNGETSLLNFSSIELKSNPSGLTIYFFDDKGKVIDIYAIDDVEHFDSLKVYAEKNGFTLSL